MKLNFFQVILNGLLNDAIAAKASTRIPPARKGLRNKGWSALDILKAMGTSILLLNRINQMTIITKLRVAFDVNGVCPLEKLSDLA